MFIYAYIFLYICIYTCINLCAYIHICTYIKYIVCFGFYGISTIVDYLMPNPCQIHFYTYKLYYFKLFSLA